MGEHAGVQSQLNKGRLELLDLSARNRLLNVPRRSKHAKTIEVADEKSAEIHRLLVREGKSLSFLPALDRKREMDGDENDQDDGGEFGELPQPDDDEVDERGVARRHCDLRLQTLLTTEKLQKRLLSLYYDAQTFREEQGVNILYLALGMLRWYEAPSSDVERQAPLLLIPVTLERKSAADRFRLRWDQEDPAGNLSLQAKLKSEFGLIIPLPEDEEELDLPGYFAAVQSAVASQPRWEVLGDDMVLGFFSFSKFLMYRDLDPANWPEGRRLDGHPLISALLQDGFEAGESLGIGEDDHIDDHISPARMIHVVDADSSQTLAIEQALGGGSMVIQGPPGTGKSQTITNIIAAAVARGEKVLFVAEKMAALDVVKRRLETIGLGAMCLELHSHKMTKTAVLADLKRTSELGRPALGENPPLIERLETLRDRLNCHSSRLNTRFVPCALTPFEVIGQLVGLQQSGRAPSNRPLTGAESWAPQQFQERERLLTDIAERIKDEGVPCRHPWRGVRRGAILRMDLDRLSPLIKEALADIERLRSGLDRLATVTGLPAARTLTAATTAVGTARSLAAAPSVPPELLAADGWGQYRGEIGDLINTGVAHHAAFAALTGVVADCAWDTDVTTARQALAVHGRSWFRVFSGEYRRAMALLCSILTGKPPRSLAARLGVFDRLRAAQKMIKVLTDNDQLGRQAFGRFWRGANTDWPALTSVWEWLGTVETGGLDSGLRLVAARLDDKAELDRLADAIQSDAAAVQSKINTLAAALALDVGEAFAQAEFDTVELAALGERLAEWLARPDDLSRWISLRVRLEEATDRGLGAFVDGLRSGDLGVDGAVPDFRFAYFETLLRMMAGCEPDLAAFQGEEHDKTIEAFRTLDRQRIELARLEVANAHHRGLPRADGGIGPLGVLRGEFARRRGHMPIRKLVRAAAPAIQALKPVFMMSPLSVAQFLEPGAISFDLLLIDEASQVMPIDALGAVARCRRMAVVGDDRQLPPSRFFAKVMSESLSEEEDEDAGGLSAGDVESILGLCVAKGLSQRMLRWHYRSRHQSLIAVSNREFYDNRLFIVPSPYTAEAGMGLRFHHLRDGVYGRGNTQTNAIEAKAVAEAVIAHARATPARSLGVATFSMKQKQAILDELELLRRQHPDTEEFFQPGGPEPFFVKNLENIQGDERDVIMISVGYGRDKSGYMAMNFGPLSSEGGERRLNVLISRAKHRCEVFASITDEDIDLERGRSRGVAALKVFLQFARTGRLEVPWGTGRGFDSVFEEQVAEAIRREGYDVRSQIGLAGFFIDLAVADPERPGRYVLGIECDGATYHSARSARDRDRLRQDGGPRLDHPSHLEHRLVPAPGGTAPSCGGGY